MFTLSIRRRGFRRFVSRPRLGLNFRQLRRCGGYGQAINLFVLRGSCPAFPRADGPPHGRKIAGVCWWGSRQVEKNPRRPELPRPGHARQGRTAIQHSQRFTQLPQAASTTASSASGAQGFKLQEGHTNGRKSGSAMPAHPPLRQNPGPSPAKISI